MKRTAIYPGTFDPITLGHIDVIERGLKMFDEIIVAVAENPSKKPFFTAGERVFLVKESLKEKKGVKVEKFGSLLVDFAKKQGCTTIIKGLREISDFTHEFQQATLNRKLCPEIETIMIVTSPEYSYINSGTIKEIFSLGGSIKGFVPKPVEEALAKAFARQSLGKTAFG